MRDFARESEDLRQITRVLSEAGSEPSSGFLGGEFGYGTEFSNTVFEMHPFYWGDCVCGHEEKSAVWHRENPHAPDCYQAAVESLGDDAYTTDALLELADAWSLPRVGCAIHCTCDHVQASKAWHALNQHDPVCPTVLPNFRHHGTGVEATWYKYIGRGMELNREPGRREWNRIVDECLASITG